MRYRTGTAFRYAVYTIAELRNGVYSRNLADIAQPAGLGTFQGYTFYGEYLYMLDGTASSSNPTPGNPHVSSVSLNGGPSPAPKVGNWRKSTSTPRRCPLAWTGCAKRDGQRALPGFEVAEDGTAIKTDAQDWPLNPPLVDLFDPQLPDQEIDRDEFERPCTARASLYELRTRRSDPALSCRKTEDYARRLR